MSLLRRLVSRLGAALGRTHWSAALAFTALVAITGCDAPGAGPTGNDGAPTVRLAMGANVVAAPGALVEAIVSFTPPGGSPVIIARDSANVDTGGSDAALSLTANVATCVGAANGDAGCVLTVTIRLSRDGVVLDETTRTVTVNASTTQVSVTNIDLFEVSTVSITPSSVTGLEPGDSVQLAAVARDRNGTTVAARTVTWSVNSGTAATVSSTGMLRAVAQGSATVRASVGGRTSDLNVSVGAPSVATLTIAPTAPAIFVGATQQFTVTARSATGAILNGNTIAYSSSAPAIATITTTGFATGVTPGTATITATTPGRNSTIVSASTSLRVDPLAIAASPNALTFETEIGQPLPAAQAVSITNTTGGNVGTLSIVTPLPTELSASLNSSTTPATLTIQPTAALAPGSNITRTITVRTSNVNVTPVAVNVTITGKTPAVLFGRFSGLVVNATNGSPIGQATVIIRNGSNTIVDQITTNGAGQWTSTSLATGTYSITVSNPNYLSVTFSGQSLVGGLSVPITSAPTAAMVPNGSNPGIIFGDVRDATNNGPLLGATVELRAGANNTTGTPLSVTTSDATGFYQFPTQPAGTYTVRATRSGYTAGSVIVPITTSSNLAPVVFLSPSGVNIAWRFVLSWGASPQDLDAHLTGPIVGQSQRFHVFFGDQGSLVASPFARLDIDETDGFGPETITISQQTTGVYRYFVDNFSGEAPIKSSTARVDVYQGTTLVQQYFPPQQDGEFWTVFEINGTTLTGIGTINNTVPLPTAQQSIGPRRIPDATAEWYLLGPSTWTKPSGKRGRSQLHH